MAIRGKHRKSYRMRSMVVAGTALAATAGLFAPAAYAGYTNPHVVVKGNAACRTFGYAPVAAQFFLANGEHPFVVWKDPFHYRTDFYAIPGGGGPVSGSPGYASVLCYNAVTGGNYVFTVAVRIQRPIIGNTQFVGLREG